MAKENIGRLFEIVLYNEDGPEFFDKLCKLETLCVDNNYSYYYITHDKDENTKVHTHYLIYTNGSTTTLDHIAKECGIKKNMIEKKNFLSSSIKYLTHESTNSTDKATYDWKDISTNDLERVEKIYSNMDENSYIREFKTYIDNRQSIIYISEFVEYVLERNLWSYYRRSAAIIKQLIEEHNKFIADNW